MTKYAGNNISLSKKSFLVVLKFSLYGYFQEYYRLRKNLNLDNLKVSTATEIFLKHRSYQIQLSFEF